MTGKINFYLLSPKLQNFRMKVAIDLFEFGEKDGLIFLEKMIAN